MRVTRARIIGGLLGVVLGAVGVGACSHDAEDCRNTRTCIPSPCVDGGVVDAGDCCEAEDGGLVCAQ